LAAGGPIPHEHRAAYARAIAEGDPDTALEIGLGRLSGLSAAAIAGIRATNAWPGLRTLAPNWVREGVAVDALPASLQRYRAIACPTLLLVGSMSPEHPLQDTSRALAQVLPNARLEVLVGQGHMALRDAPEVVARLIADFLAA
jgi:pimeloyl-ACP methyl ester carboxylesterase